MMKEIKEENSKTLVQLDIHDEILRLQNTFGWIISDLNKLDESTKIILRTTNVNNRKINELLYNFDMNVDTIFDNTYKAIINILNIEKIETEIKFKKEEK